MLFHLWLFSSNRIGTLYFNFGARCFVWLGEYFILNFNLKVRYLTIYPTTRGLTHAYILTMALRWKEFSTQPTQSKNDSQSDVSEISVENSLKYFRSLTYLGHAWELISLTSQDKDRPITCCIFRDIADSEVNYVEIWFKRNIPNFLRTFFWELHS